MYIPKRYGQSKIDKCPFCGRQAFAKNKQDVPVCTDHKNTSLDEMKCMCGKTLEMRSGKWGIFFSCLNCGNLNLRKALEINDGATRRVVGTTSETETRRETEAEQRARQPREITIRSDDPDYF